MPLEIHSDNGALVPRRRSRAGAAKAQLEVRGTVAEPPIHILAEVFPEFTRVALESLVRMGRVVAYPARMTLCREGDVESRFFVVIDGRVDVHKLLEGELLFINHLGRGGHFGDIGLLLDVPRTATIITAEPSRIFEVDRAHFTQLIKTHEGVGLTLAQMVIKRFLVQEEKHLVEVARLKKRYLPRQPKVFVSYARADGPFVTRLANHLLKLQIDVWLDVYRLDPGRSWARQIGEALDTCHLMLLVLSPASVSSGNVEDEWNYYLDQKKAAVTVLHQPCQIPYRLSKFQYINFHETDFDLAVARLAATLNTQLVVTQRAPRKEKERVPEPFVLPISKTKSLRKTR